jgi:pyruvate/2-oxoglutarate dehydrogenase complex dihydrolipoamide acyltransferase (E2) component
VGGIARKPGVIREGAGTQAERVEVREYLALTLSMDHDLIDGALAARFTTYLSVVLADMRRVLL